MNLFSNDGLRLAVAHGPIIYRETPSLSKSTRGTSVRDPLTQRNPLYRRILAHNLLAKQFSIGLRTIRSIWLPNGPFYDAQGLTRQPSNSTKNKIGQQAHSETFLQNLLVESLASTKMNQMKLPRYLVITIASVLVATGCAHAPVQHSSFPAQTARPTAVTSNGERDEIYSLLAYAVVYKDWQSSKTNQRGHNIGAVLVDPKGKLVNWARNCNQITQNGTQHAELRLMLGYQSKVHSYNLEGAIINFV